MPLRGHGTYLSVQATNLVNLVKHEKVLREATGKTSTVALTFPGLVRAQIPWENYFGRVRGVQSAFAVFNA